MRNQTKMVVRFTKAIPTGNYCKTGWIGMKGIDQINENWKEIEYMRDHKPAKEVKQKSK